jgi:hypothetical protein
VWYNFVGNLVIHILGYAVTPLQSLFPIKIYFQCNDKEFWYKLFLGWRLLWQALVFWYIIFYVYIFLYLNGYIKIANFRPKSEIRSFSEVAFQVQK